MSTTTIRLPDALRARISRLASANGTTAHGLIVDAITHHVDAAEARASFLAEGTKRLAEMERTGMAVPWDEAKAYLARRAAGQTAQRPLPRATTVLAEDSAHPLAKPGPKPKQRPHAGAAKHKAT